MNELELMLEKGGIWKIESPFSDKVLGAEPPSDKLPHLETNNGLSELLYHLNNYRSAMSLYRMPNSILF